MICLYLCVTPSVIQARVDVLGFCLLRFSSLSSIVIHGEIVILAKMFWQLFFSEEIWTTFFIQEKYFFVYLYH